MMSFDLGSGWGAARLLEAATLRKASGEAVSYAADGVALAWSPGRDCSLAGRYACDVECEGQRISEQLVSALGCEPEEAVAYWTRLETACKLRGVPILEAVVCADRRRWLFESERAFVFRTVVVAGKVCTFGVALRGWTQSAAARSEG